MATDITREQWVSESERLCPSGLAFNAYEELEQFIVDETDLTVTYQSVSRGKNDFATFLATAGPKCEIVQVYKGQCQFNWKLKTKLPGLTEEEREQVEAAYEKFRKRLNGKEGKGWETVKVLKLGEEEVQEAIKEVADSICLIVNQPSSS